MADTIRSLSELNSLLADNTVGSVSTQDLRDLMVSQMVHGEIGSGPKTPIALGASWQALDFDVAREHARQAIEWAKANGAARIIYKRKGRLRSFDLTRR